MSTDSSMDMTSAGQVLDLSLPAKGKKSRLARTIVGLLKLSILLGSPVAMMEVSYAQDTSELETVEVTYDWEEPPFVDPWDPGWYPEQGGSGGSTGDDGGSGDGETPPPRSCEQLRATKPPSCPNPIPMPQGYGYGRELFASGRAIPKIINFIENQPYVAADARQWARVALEYQTIDFAGGTITYETSTRILLSLLTAACRVQTREDEGIRWSGTPATVAERACLDMLNTATAEANNQSFFQFFNWWSEKEGIPLTTLGIPEPVVNYFSPQNSLRVKYDAVSADALCSRWWTEVQANQCSL